MDTLQDNHNTLDNEMLTTVNSTHLRLLELLNPTLALIFIIIGYVGNIITCIVIVCNKSMRTTTNVYLLNLAIADLTIMSSRIIRDVSTLNYRFLIVVVNSILQGSLYVAIMTISAFTFERYLAICRPFLARRMSSIPNAVKLISLIWIIGIILGYIIHCQINLYRHIKTIDSECCFHVLIPYMFLIDFLVFFLLPFMLMMVLYILIGKRLAESFKIKKYGGESKNVNDCSEIQTSNVTEETSNSNRKAIKMLVTVVAVFFICWAPFNTINLLRFHVQIKELTPDINVFNFTSALLECIYEVAFTLSTAVNPIIYSAMSKKFREAFKELLYKCCYICRKRKQINIKFKNEVDETII